VHSVLTSTTNKCAIGTVEGSFGKSGKYKVNFPKGIPEDMTNK
jgi:hypothetical protein